MELFEVIIGQNKDLSDKCSIRFNMFIFLMVSCIMALVAYKNYALYHSIIELYCVSMEFAILLIGLNTYKISNGYYTFISIAFGFIGIFDLLHTLSYKGIGIFNGSLANLAAQLWICARYLQSISLLIAYIYIRRKLKVRLVVSVYALATLLLLASIFFLKVFPVCYIDNVGLTNFKRISEVVICAVLVAAIRFTRHSKNELSVNLCRYIFLSLFVTILSEGFFIFYKDVYGIFNFSGHILKALAFYLLYRVFIEGLLRKPYNTLFYKLNDSYDKLKNELVERESLENKLFESEEKYRTLVELMTDSVFLHDGFRFLYANKAGLDMLGYDNLDEFYGTSIFKIVHKDYHNSVQETLYKNELGITPPPTEKQYIRKDGDIIYIESTSTKILFKGKTAFIVVARDVSARKQLEREQKLLEKAREYEKLRAEFFSNISHEFRTPLNVILGAVQLMDLYGNDVHNKNSLSSSIKRNCFRLLRISNNLIDIAKINAGLVRLNLENKNIVSVIEDITMEVENFIRGQGIEIIFDTEVEEKIVAIDSEKIERIFLNLLSNAVKFNKEKGKIFVSLCDNNGYTKIIVEDTGVGIPEDYLEIIFENFVQVNKSLIRNREGSGLGLSIVKCLTEMHGGRVYVESHLGKGSRFMVEIPDIILNDEVAVTADEGVLVNRIEKINVEFSDVYLSYEDLYFTKNYVDQ